MIKEKDRVKKPRDEDKDLIDWGVSYIKSPKYRERLSAFYKYPGYIQNQRAARASAIDIKDVTGNASRYDPASNTINYSTNQANNSGISREEILAHEHGHSVNSPDNPSALRLSPREEAFIFDRAKIDPDIRQSVKDTARRQALGLSEYLKITPSLHDYKPSETHSDINALRFLLNKRGIYDAGTQDVTPDILQKAAKDPIIRKSFIFKRLKDSFEEKDLIEIMNKIAANKGETQSNLV